MTRYILFCVLATSVIVIAAKQYQRSEQRVLLSDSQSREARVRLQHAEQRLHRLEQGKANPLLTVLGEDVTALQIRMAEVLESMSRDLDTEPGIQPSEVSGDTGFQDDLNRDTNWPGPVVAYEQSLLPEALSFDSDVSGNAAPSKNVYILRIDVQLAVAHAPALLVALEHLRSAAAGWPVEVRACEVHRSEQRLLTGRCIVDIYHWTSDVSPHR